MALMTSGAWGAQSLHNPRNSTDGQVHQQLQRLLVHRRTPLHLQSAGSHQNVCRLRSRHQLLVVRSQSGAVPADRTPGDDAARKATQLREQAAGGAAEPRAAEGDSRPYWKQLLTPYRDPACNSKLLALCGAGMLSSIATLIHDTYLPVYLQDVLGLSNTRIGNLQAVAQFLSNFTKSASGTIGDLLSPARMVIFGTMLTTLNKPMFAASGWVYASYGTVATVYWVTSAKIADRMSKGIREAPTKALMGELAVKSGDRPEQAFGLRQSAQTFGAIVGASIASMTFRLSGSNYIATFALSAIPAAIALLVVTLAFRDEAREVGAAKKAQRAADKAARNPDDVQLTFPQKAKAFVGALKPTYWQALIVVCVIYFTRFDWSFVVLRAKQVMPKSQLAGLTMCTMLVQTVAAPPLSRIAKRSVRMRNRMLLLGLAPMVAANAVFATATSALGMAAGALLIGLHMAATHGVTLGMMSSAIPATTVPGLGRVSGTAWSFTDFVLGIVLAYSNRFAGQLSDLTVQRGMGNVGCFYGGGAAALAAAFLIILFWRFGSLGQDPLEVEKRKQAQA